MNWFALSQSGKCGWADATIMRSGQYRESSMLVIAERKEIVDAFSREKPEHKWLDVKIVESE